MDHLVATRMPQATVICLGLSALDQIWRVDALLPPRGGKVRASEYSSIGGGMAATAAVAIARLGGRAAFWGRGGEDAAGFDMRDELAAAGVDVTGFKLFPTGRSSVSGVIVDRDGERQIVNFRGSFPEEAAWLPLGDVTAATAVLADPRWVSGASALFTAARAGGVPSVLDADVAEASVFETLLPLVDHVVFSEPALSTFAGSHLEGALRDVSERFGCRVAAVTRGHNGVLWREGDRLRQIPAFAVETVDTTGAGDAFHGAYALALGAGAQVPEAMTFASAVAALKCTRHGGRAGLPVLDETLNLIRTST